MENEVPEVYVAKSRDFQVLMRLLSAAFNANRVDIQQLQFLSDARRINERLLPLLQTKIGFFTKKTFTTEELRDVCDIFATDVRDKGARIGIEEAIRTFFAARNITTDFYIDIKNELPEDVDGEPYSISIGLSQEVGDIDLLEEILRYIIPTGYFLTIFIYRDWDNSEIDVDKKSNYQIAYRNNILYSKPSNYYTSQKFEKKQAEVNSEREFRTYGKQLYIESIQAGSFIPRDKYEEGKTYYYFEALEQNMPSWYVKEPYGEKEKSGKLTTEFYYKEVDNSLWYDENAIIQGSAKNDVEQRRRLSILQTIDTTSIARAGREEESDK